MKLFQVEILTPLANRRCFLELSGQEAFSEGLPSLKHCHINCARIALGLEQPINFRVFRYNVFYCNSKLKGDTKK